MRKETLFTLPWLGISLLTFSQFIVWVESRPGVVLPDPILALYSAKDVSFVTFTLIYGALFGAILIFRKNPEKLLRIAQSYAVMVWIRMLAMYFSPLDPPPTLIPLADPFVQFFATAKPLTKDLFFSGHTATLFLLSLFMEKQPVRGLYFLATAVVAFCVLLQHVHYSVDVIAAPAFSYLAFRLAGVFQFKSNKRNSLSPLID